MTQVFSPPVEVQRTNKFALSNNKIPVNLDGKQLSKNNLSDWLPFDAIKYQQGYKCWLCHPSDGLFYLDIDKCFDASGIINSYAQDLIDAFDTYTELSLSGTGIHIIGKCSPYKRVFSYNKDGGCKKSRGIAPHAEIGLELYNYKNLVVTNDVYQNRSEIRDCDYAVDCIVGAVFDRVIDKALAPSAPALAPVTSGSRTDEQVMTRFKKWKAYEYWTEGKDGESEKDFAVICALYKLTNHDAAQTYRLFFGGPRWNATRKKKHPDEQRYFNRIINSYNKGK